MEWGVAGQAGPRRSQWPGANVDSDENWRRAPWSPQQGVLVQKIMLIKQPPHSLPRPSLQYLPCCSRPNSPLLPRPKSQQAQLHRFSFTAVSFKSIRS